MGSRAGPAAGLGAGQEQEEEWRGMQNDEGGGRRFEGSSAAGLRPFAASKQVDTRSADGGQEGPGRLLEYGHAVERKGTPCRKKASSS